MSLFESLNPYMSCQNLKWPHTRKSMVLVYIYIYMCVHILYMVYQVSPKDFNFLAQRLSTLGHFFFAFRKKKTQKLDFSPFFHGTYDPEWTFGMRCPTMQKKRPDNLSMNSSNTNKCSISNHSGQSHQLWSSAFGKKIQKYLPKIWFRTY